MAQNRHDDHFTEEISVPKTLTPWVSILIGDLLVFAVIWGVVSFLLYPFLDEQSKWGAIVAIATIGLMIQNGTLATDIPDWNGVMVFNTITKRRRVMFPGFHLKLWWEKLELPLTSLKREVPASVETTFATNDPAESMDVKILIHMRLDTRPKPPEQDAKNFERFISIEDHALAEILKGRVENMFGEHYGASQMEDLLKLHQVQKAVLHDNEDNHRALHRLEQQYGGHIGIELKKSQPDDATKAMKRTPARAEALRDAIKKLTDAGVPVDDARRAALLLDDTAEFSEQRVDFNIDVTAPDLKNLQNVSVVGMPGNFGGPDTSKKGGKK